MASHPERPDRAPEPDSPAARAAALSRASTALREAEPEPVPQQALVDPKFEIAYFVSYSREEMNRKLALDLLARLRVRFTNCPEFRFVGWIDGEDIEPGDRWQEEIGRAIDRCHFGLLLVSQHFLASDFITKNELPHFVAAEEGSTEPRRRAVPVGLQRIPFDDSIDLKGLRERQVFRDEEGKFYGERTGQRRERFADELYQRILRVVRKRLAASPPPRAETDADDDPLTRLERLQDLALQKLPGYVPTRGRRAGLDKSADPSEVPSLSGEQVDAVDFLTDWAADPQAPAFCALLGEYGMGKTTTCEAFSRRLLEERESKPNLPVPIYLDLRHLGDAAKSNPFLDEILLIVGSRSHATGRSAKESPRPEELMNLVQSGRAIAIFDGLDEVLVHLTPSQGQRFTRELWRISPPRLLPAKGKAQAEQPRGKVLISCRTHYFRTLREEQTHFLGEGREKIAPSDYRALVLLPFSTEQIEEYLAKNLPGQDVEKLLDLIRSVHNLKELAERPYTLKLIAEHIPKLEQWKLEGRKVTGVTLYREMVSSWLERDAGKHTLTIDHKLSLMERFAAELWISGKRSWSAKDLEQWLMNFLADPQVKEHYEGKDRDLLKEDLRTATFLVRDGEDGFRFAHTSLQEFFLAAHLHRTLREKRFEAWQIPRPSPETLDFLGQLIAEKDETEVLTAFRELRGAYRPQASELMLAYALRAREKGLPVPVLAGFRLDGAQLKNWTIAAPKGTPPLDLQGASLRGANLDGAKIYRVNLSRADFGGADLTCAEWIGGKGEESRFRETILVGTVFRDLDLGGADFESAKLHRAQWLRCILSGVVGLGDATSGFFAECGPGRWNVRPESAKARLATFEGHGSGFNSCAFSPDGSSLASGSDDGTVRIWDAATGEALRVLEGHRRGVRFCTFSPNGSLLASAGSDGTVRLWETASGKTLRVLEGRHRRGFNTCVFSPDGSRLASASDDGTVRLWRAASGETLWVIEGHRRGAWSCSFSPDGSRLASSGGDDTVRLWDAATGKVLRVLQGHRGRVWSCAFSPDGKCLASAGDDATVRLWDAATGETLRVLIGQRRGRVWYCVFSPDGSRLASASEDGIVQLWDTATGEAHLVLVGHRRFVRSCAFSLDGSRLASADKDGMVRIWETATGETLRVLEGQGSYDLLCAYTPDGSRLATASGDGSVQFWDVATGEAVRILEGHRGGVLSCTFSPDGSRLASAGEDGTVRLWKAANGELLGIYKGHRGGVLSCTFSFDGARLASTGDDSTVRIWNTAHCENLRVLEGHEGLVWSCSFSPDGLQLASAGDDGTVRVWDATSGEALHVLKQQDWVRCCAYSPDGSRLASGGGDGTLRLWDTATGKPLPVLGRTGSWIMSCAFARTGSNLAAGGGDGIVRLWAAARTKVPRVFEGHRGEVFSCEFSSGGSRFASAGADGAVRLWDVEQGRELGRIQFLPGGEVSSFFGPDLALSYASPGAWRWLGWLAPDPETGEITRYPAEIFGPLPGPDEKGGYRER